MNTNGRPVTIVDRHAAEALAEQILAPRRLFPLVVVTTPAGRTDPYVPATELIDAISQRADVVSVTQQASNWLSTRLEELGRSDLNVYGSDPPVPHGTAGRRLGPDLHRPHGGRWRAGRRQRLETSRWNLHHLDSGASRRLRARP